MTPRCETCPLQSFCTDLIQADTQNLGTYQDAQTEVELQLILVNAMAAESDSYSETSLDMLEHPLFDADENIAESATQYLQLTTRQTEFHNHVEALRATICQLLASYTLSMENLEKRLALSHQLQDLVACGCERGPISSACSAPGAWNLKRQLGAIPLVLPGSDNAA